MRNTVLSGIVAETAQEAVELVHTIPCGMLLSVSLRQYDKLVDDMDGWWSGRYPYSVFSKNG